MERSDVLEALDGLVIEVPYRAYGNSGTRFTVFAQAGAAGGAGPR